MWWRKNPPSQIKILKRINSNKQLTWKLDSRTLERKQLKTLNSMKRTTIAQPVNKV